MLQPFGGDDVGDGTLFQTLQGKEGQSYSRAVLKEAKRTAIYQMLSARSISRINLSDIWYAYDRFLLVLQ